MREVQRLKDEAAILKAQVREADKSRDTMVRELSSAKDDVHMKIRESESRKDAEIKLLGK